MTSRAVVGSSAMSSLGSLESAMAIIARWRMPPENSCGYWSSRRLGSGMPTRSSSSAARARAAADSDALCAPASPRPAASRPCRTGCSADSGSWKIIATSLPRTRRSLSSAMVTMSWPSNMIRPADRGALLTRVSPSVVSDETVLPEPGLADDPQRLARLRGCRRCRRRRGPMPSPVRNETRRSSTESSGSPSTAAAACPCSRVAHAWVEIGVRDVDDDVGNDDEQRRQDNCPLDDRKV